MNTVAHEPEVIPAIPETPNAAEEARLLADIAQGNPESLEAFHRQYHSLLFSCAYGVLNNREAAEDVVQDVLLQLWQKAQTYSEARGKALTWVISMTRNKAIDRLRAIQRRSRLYERAGEQEKTGLQFDDRDSLREALRNERGAAVRAALDILNDEQRESIRMAFFEDMPYHAVANRLGVRLGTIKARIRRGMARMRQALHGQVQPA
jgi:RNA polymerase sigma-70 factor, ECF subfamily